MWREGGCCWQLGSLLWLASHGSATAVRALTFAPLVVWLSSLALGWLMSSALGFDGYGDFWEVICPKRAARATAGAEANAYRPDANGRCKRPPWWTTGLETDARRPDPHRVLDDRRRSGATSPCPAQHALRARPLAGSAARPNWKAGPPIHSGGSGSMGRGEQRRLRSIVPRTPIPGTSALPTRRNQRAGRVRA